MLHANRAGGRILIDLQPSPPWLGRTQTASPKHLRTLVRRGEVSSSWAMLLWASVAATMVTVLFGSALSGTPISGSACTPACVQGPEGPIHVHSPGAFAATASDAPATTSAAAPAAAGSA